MKIHIQRDRFDRGIALWMYNASDGVGAYLPASDPHNIEEIDPEAQTRLIEFLNLGESGNWENYGIDATTLATAISSALARIDAAKPTVFDEESVFVPPAPLARALSLESEPIILSDWLARFPHSRSHP